MNNFFVHKGNKYYKGTIVNIQKEKQNETDFLKTLKFVGTDEKENCIFISCYDTWQKYYIHQSQINAYIELIISPVTMESENKTIFDPNYIDGMVSAWIWYLLIMFFALFLKEIFSVLIVWTLSSYIFFSWRTRKINGEE